MVAVVEVLEEIRDRDIPVLVNGPGPRHAPHQADEYVEIEELYEAARISVLTTFRYLNQERTA